jgi:hypothetical protein
MTDTSCTCESCQEACSIRPGWLSPEEIEPLASGLGLSVEELFHKHLMVDWWVGDEEDIFILAPAIREGTAGTLYPAYPRGCCVWFAEGRCSIHYVGKPNECRGLIHSFDEEYKSVSRESLALRWVEHQDLIKSLLGYTPTVQTLTPFDIDNIMKNEYK